MAERDWDSRAYRAWRLAVKKRDGFKCRKCGSRKRLQVHHIKRWAENPELRYSVSNGVTLCKACHGHIWNKEQDYEELFRRLVNPDGFLQIQRMLHETQTDQTEEQETS